MIKVILPIVPPKGTAQQQKTAVIGGKVRKYDPKSVKQAKALMTQLLAPHKPASPLEGALSLCLRFVYPYRVADRKNAQGADIFKNTQPDCDNLTKGLQDVLEKLEYFNNDGQIAKLEVTKVWGMEPRIIVNLSKL